MTKRIAIAAGLLISTFGVDAAMAGGRPAWCKDAAKDDSYSLDDLSKKDAAKVVIVFVNATCSPNAEAEARRDDIEKARLAWSKRLDMIESDWADAVEYAKLDYGTRMALRVQIRTEKLNAAWSSYDAIDQWGMIGEPIGASGALVLDPDYLADAFGTHLTEVGRASYVRNCLQSQLPVKWAMCAGDIAALDYAKLATELRASTAYSGVARMAIRFSVDHLRKEKLPEHAADVKKLLATDPGYQQLFDASAAAWKDWTARYKTDAAVIDLAASMDDARATNSRKAWAGCEDKTWAAWKAQVSAIPAKQFEGMFNDAGKAMGAMVSNPSVYLASVALVTCMTVGQERDRQPDYLIRMLGGSMGRWPGFRGPRTATESAILTAGITLDDRNARIDYPSTDRPFGGNGGTSGGGSGVVASVKPSAKGVVITFKKQLVKQVQCAESRRTNRVTRIGSDGTLVYETICTRNETVVVDKSDDPQTVNARYAEGVKPGMFVHVVEDVVESAQAKPGSSTPSIVFGAVVK